VEAIARAMEADASGQAPRVLLVAPPARGGLARHVSALLAGLEAGGYEVGVVCEPGGPIAEAARARRVVPVFPLVRRGRRGPLAALQVAYAAGQMRAQIVHTHSFRAGVAGALAMPLARQARLIATIHNYLPGGDGMRPRRRRDAWALRALCRRASRIITVSEALGRDLETAWPEASGRWIAIPNGVDLQSAEPRPPAEVRRELGLPAEGPLVGMIARLAPQKGIPEFLKAAQWVCERHPEVHFALVGEGPLREEAERLRADLGLETRLTLVGEVDSPRGFAGALAALVVASTSEGSSLAAMEAMAAGRPVVATAVGGVPEVVADGETGLLIPPGDAEALGAAVEALLADPERAAEMGERGRRRAAERFDIRLMLARTKAVYGDVLREQLAREGRGR